MSAQPQARLTPEQYLEIERASEFRSEYYNGRLYAMSGGSYNHVRIIGNLAFELRNALRQRPCEVTTSDLRLRVSPNGLYTYPDVTVVCGEPKFADDQKDTLLNPVFIAEVLSPSTEAYDRGFKSVQYRKLESLQEYALVSQAEPRVEVFRRQPGGDWLLSEAAGLDAACGFDSLGCRIALADIYGKVTFDAADLIPPRPPAV
jgi:Uma2 family endonuclease